MTREDERTGATDRLGEAAELVAIRTGLLKKCPTHGDVYDPGQRDFQGALMVAAYLINQSDPLVAPFAGDRQALAELLKAILQTHPRGCPQCTPDAG